MSERPQGVSDEDRISVWNMWLDGDSVSRIAEWSMVSRSAVKAVLAAEPPAEIASDGRYVHGGRFFWIAATAGPENPATGTRDAFVMVKSPRTYTGDAFRKAVRAIRRDVRSDGGDLDIGCLEGIEADAFIKFVTERGYRGYQFDERGAISRFVAVASPDPDQRPGLR